MLSLLSVLLLKTHYNDNSNNNNDNEIDNDVGHGCKTSAVCPDVPVQLSGIL